MIDKGSSNAKRDSSPIDLAEFGFDQPGDKWIETFRDARNAEPIGRMGSYELLAEAGRGGQGVVYRARCVGDTRIVAIKRLIGGKFAAAELRRRFEREMHAIAALNHPNITRAIDIDEADGQSVIVMEWIDGTPLNEWARRREGARRTEEITSLFVQICDAVQHAHIRGVIHRDLKPSNVLVVAEKSGAVRPVILDFGMARIVGDPTDALRSTTTGRFLGTLAYAAPEQVAGGAPTSDALTDVHAMGVMLYEALTGRHPFAGDGSLADLVRSIQEAMPERASSVSPGISRDLDAIVRKALAKSPAERYQSVDALAADLRRHLAGEPVSARTPGALYLAGKLMRRHPLPCAASLLAFVVVSALAFALYVANQRERAALHVARTTSAFLSDTLAAAEPARGGADVTLIDVLQQAGERAEHELADTPESAADVHLAIGKTYSSLWRWRDAIPHLEKAVALCRDHAELGESKLADALRALGRAYTSTRNPEAIAVQQEALTLRRKLFGPTDHRVAESLKEVAYALQQAADPPQWESAKAHYEEAIAMLRATLGPDHRETASCLHNFGWMRVRQRRYLDSVELYRQALEIFRRTNRRNDPFYAECLFGYTAQLSVLGRDSENLDVLNELIPLLRASHGDRQVDDLYWSKAEALTRLNRFDEANDAYAEAFAGLFDSCDLALNADERDADAMCDTLLEQLPAIPENEVRTVLTFGVDFARFHIAAGRAARATVILDRVSAAIHDRALDAPLIQSMTAECLGDLAADRSDTSAAIEHYRAGLALSDHDGLAFDRQHAWLTCRLGEELCTAGDKVAGVERLRAACERLREQCGPDHRRTLEAQSLLAKWTEHDRPAGNSAKSP